jgi:hypothetical protein
MNMADLNGEHGTGTFRFPVFEEPHRRGMQFSRYELEKGNEILADRAQLFSRIHGIKYGEAIKLVARRDGLSEFI